MSMPTGPTCRDLLKLLSPKTWEHSCCYHPPLKLETSAVKQSQSIYSAVCRDTQEVKREAGASDTHRLLGLPHARVAGVVQEEALGQDHALGAIADQTHAGLVRVHHLAEALSSGRKQPDNAGNKSFTHTHTHR